ncbi:MAG: cation:proton antiporter [Candidatus Kariarchaeaceae archaeon]
MEFFLDPVIFVGSLVGLGISLSFIFQKIGIPHVVVYIITGFILSNTLFIGTDLLSDYGTMFHIVEIIALGMIGFKIGTELHIKSLMEKARELVALVLGNTGLALIFVVVAVLLTTPNLAPLDRWVVALILGGVATATAPAATVEIIRKYKAKGMLTSLVLAVLALNDLVAIVFVEVMLVVIRGSFSGSLGLDVFISGIAQEIGLSIVLGMGVGLALDFVVERMHDDLEMMELTLGVLIFTIGVADYIHTSVILTTMIIGITVTNRKGDNYEKAGDLLEIIMSPIVTLFFVLVGAKILVSDFSPFPYLVIVYFVARLLGKYVGSYVGASAIGQTPEVKQNLGFAMFAQGGVALGLASIIGETLVEVGRDDLATLVVSVIIIGTVFAEILGTLTTKYALTRAGEITGVPDKEPLQEHTRTVHYHD